MEERPTQFLDPDREARPYVIEGPGDVAIEYLPAGLGSRFLAALLDHLIVVCLLIFLIVVLQFVAESGIFVAGASIILYLAYFAVLESRSGRTPGKAALGLRVMSESGLPVAPRAALIRNILRIADFLPWGFPGVVVMVIDRHARRLGDLLGGTVVVREGRSTLSRDLLLMLPYRERPYYPEEALQRITLTPAEYQALRTLCFRTRTLSPARRLRLARLLLAPLHARAGIPLPAGHEQEQLLIDLLHAENRTFGLYVPGVTAPYPGAPPPGPA